MQVPADFSEVLGNIDDFLVQATNLHGMITNPRYKEMYGELLGQARELRVEAEAVVPNAIQLQTELKEQVDAKIKQQRESQPRLKAEREQMVENAKRVAAKREAEKKELKAKPVKADLKKVKMPPAWGDQLKGELLNKFGNLPSAPVSAPRDAAIWDDWQWNSGGKPMGEG